MSKPKPGIKDLLSQLDNVPKVDRPQVAPIQDKIKTETEIRDKLEKTRKKPGPQRHYKPQVETVKTSVEITRETFNEMLPAVAKMGYYSRNTFVNAAIRAFIGLNNQDKDVLNDLDN